MQCITLCIEWAILVSQLLATIYVLGRTFYDIEYLGCSSAMAIFVAKREWTN